jgi:predicted homoserine dehydrogenase-like protein
VLTIAKRDLKAGERLDGVGGFCTYGLIDNRAAARAVGALPIGLSEDCVLRRHVAKDEVISFDDVESPHGRLAEKLWREQDERWPLDTTFARAQFGQAPLGSERISNVRPRVDAISPV